MSQAPPSALQIWTQQNCIGTVSLAQRGQQICVWILMFLISPPNWSISNTCAFPWSYFLWIQEQYNLKVSAYKGYVHLEMGRAVWGLPQAGILANKRLRRKLTPYGYFEHISTPGLWYHETRPFCSHWW
jgi:hypothetical protein